MMLCVVSAGLLLVVVLTALGRWGKDPPSIISRVYWFDQLRSELELARVRRRNGAGVEENRPGKKGGLENGTVSGPAIRPKP